MKKDDQRMQTNGCEVINAYRELESQASRMLGLAREHDWDAMIGEGERYVTAAAALADLERGCTLDDDEHRAKYDILERTLDYDLEIRTHLMAHREELGQVLASSRRERALAGAYGVARPVAVGGPPRPRKRQQ